MFVTDNFTLFHGESILLKSEPWHSVEEIARHLGVSKETIYRWLERAKIPAHRVGKLWKFKISEVDKWVTVGGAAEPATAVGRKSTNRPASK